MARVRLRGAACHHHRVQQPAVSALLGDFIGDQRKIDPELQNRDGDLITLRIDSKLLKDAEIKALNQTQEEAAKELREVVATQLGNAGKRASELDALYLWVCYRKDGTPRT